MKYSAVKRQQISDTAKGKTIQSLEWVEAGGYWLMTFASGEKFSFRFTAELGGLNARPTTPIFMRKTPHGLFSIEIEVHDIDIASADRLRDEVNAAKGILRETAAVAMEPIERQVAMEQIPFTAPSAEGT